jgi:DNA replication protein DnaC
MTLKSPETALPNLLATFRLFHTAETIQAQAKEAANQNLSHLEFLERLLTTEDALRHERIVRSRVKDAKIPVIKTMDVFDWAHPTAISKPTVLNAFHLDFIENKANLVLVGPSGVGKTHIALALAYAACQKEIKTLWITAADIVNSLTAAKADHSLSRAINRFCAPKLLVIDELGFLPLDKDGSDLFFQVMSHRYEQGSVVLTTNRPFKDWGKIFNDNTVASAILDRLVHHSDVVKIEGPSYRVKNRKEQRSHPAGE